MKRTILIVVAIILIGVGGTLWWRSRGNGKTPPTQFETVKVERGAVKLTVSADGALQPLTTVSVKSYAGGTVDLLAVEVGDIVQPGDLIAKIDPTDSLTAYEQAQADMSAAQARLSQAKEEAGAQPELTRTSIAQADANYNSAVKDLQRLQKATQPQTRAQVRAALDKAQANLDLAEKQLARTKDLNEKGFVPERDVDDAKNQRDLAKAELESTRERWNTLDDEQASELEASKARVAQAKASLEQARANSIQGKLRDADVASARASVARAQAQLDNARTMLEYTTIRAPRAGVILQKLVEQGSIVTSGRSSVSQGTDIVLLGDLTKMFVEVNLDEADVDKVNVGQEVDIHVEAIPNRTFQGIVTRVNPQAITEQNITTILVTVEVENPGVSVESNTPAAQNQGETGGFGPRGDSAGQRPNMANAQGQRPSGGFGQRENNERPGRRPDMANAQGQRATESVQPRIRRSSTGILKPGMTATCDFLVQKKNDVLFLPSRAIRGMGDENTVQILKGGVPTDVPVSIGLVGDDQTEIVKGLKEGQAVVIPSAAGLAEEFRDRMRERGREAGGGGFVRQNSNQGGGR